MKRFLNVGGNNKKILVPRHFSNYEHILLDIDPKGGPDIVCDARELTSLGAKTFDAIYCSHNLEHYYRHEVPKVLAGFAHILKDEGFVQIRVPDIAEVMQTTINRGLDIDDVLYTSRSGPIRVSDVIYGYSVEIERSGQDFFAHKIGFTKKSLLKVLFKSGFSRVYTSLGNFEINAFAFKDVPDQFTRELLNLPEDENLDD